MERKLYALSGQDTFLRAGSKQQLQDIFAAEDVSSSSSWTHSCHRIARRGPRTATRHAPYPTAGSNDNAAAIFSSDACAFAASQKRQIAAAEAAGPVACTYQPTQQQQQLLAGRLRQQPLESLLDLAISLAGKSLSRTMESCQVACNCWASSSTSHAAVQALEVAEECMTRTRHRMQIVQQLAAAALSRKQTQALAAHQAQQQQRLLNMM